MTTEENNLPEQEYKITRGIPGSGKSTYATKWVAFDPANRVRVSRDDIRLSLFGKYIVLDRKGKIDGNAEAQVSIVEESQLRKALDAKKSVISDKTNINQKDIDTHRALAKEYGVKLTHKDFPITLEEAKRRNSLRERVVENFVIERMYNNLGPEGQFHHFDGDYPVKSFVAPLERKLAFGFDMDGTLSDTRSINHYVQGKFKNFDMFHRSSIFTPANPEVLKLAMDAHDSGLAVIITTARNEKYREVTQLWLDRLNVPYENIFMRKDGDNRPDYVVKNEMLHEQILPFYQPVCMADDNIAAVSCWRENGIRVIEVPGWGQDIPQDVVLKIDNVFSRGGCVRCGRPLKNGGTLGPKCAKF
jgi:predicted kinase